MCRRPSLKSLLRLDSTYGSAVLIFVLLRLRFRWYWGFCLLWAHRIQVLMWSELNYKADWDLIASRMAKRGYQHSAKQCYVRYLHKLHPQLKKGSFTKQEEGKTMDKGGHSFISCNCQYASIMGWECFLWHRFHNPNRRSKEKQRT